MITQPAQDKFALNYYEWSLGDAQRELDQNLRFMRSVKSPGALADVKYLDNLNASERQAFMMALVKNANSRALELLGENLSIYEQGLIRHYRENIMILVGSFMDQLYQERQRDPAQKVKKRRLARTVKEKLQPHCGKISFKDSALIWTHIITIDDWEMHTEIDMGGWDDLRYWHSIVQPKQASALQTGLCMRRWLGFSSTEWSMLNQSEEAATANSLEKFCQHFIAAVPALLKGIST